MRVAVMLPVFEQTTRPALESAAEAAAAGLHGVLCYDHLWPMGRPGEPAIDPFPLLAAVASRHPDLMLGTLVARVGLESDAVLAAKFQTLAAIAPGRVIAAIGTGDHKSAAENVAFGIAMEAPALRRAALVRVLRALEGSVAERWIGGGHPATNAIASELDVTLNLWAADPDRVAAAATEATVSWGGQLPTDPEAAAAKLAALARAGASWAAVSWKRPAGALGEIAAAAGVVLAR